MAWTTSDRVVRWRIRSAAVDLAVETLDGWRRHLVGRNVAVLTYYGFLALFPLFMVATTVLGLVLQNNPRLQDEILDTAVAQIPVIGSEIQRRAGELSGSITTVVVGLVIALWAATRAFVGIQVSFDDSWEVAIDRRDNVAVRRVKSLLGLAIIGTSLVAATALSGLVSVGNLPWGGRLLTLLGTIAINIGVLAAMFRFLTAARVSWRDALPGAIFGGLGFTVLQIAGTTIVQRFLSNAADTTGVFATVFALMAWINLHAVLSLTGAELNAAMCRRRRAKHEAGQWLRSGLGHADLHQLP
jgi:membrane protein